MRTPVDQPIRALGRRLMLVVVAIVVGASTVAWSRPAVASAAPPQLPAPQVFTFAGGKPQTVTVPDGATGVLFEVVGASGGRSAPGESTTGGPGAVVRGQGAVSSGAVLTVTVGGAGGDVGSVRVVDPVPGGLGWANGGPGGANFQGSGGGGASALSSSSGLIGIAAGGGGVGGTGFFGGYAGGAGGAAGSTAGDGGRGGGPQRCLAPAGRGGAAPEGAGGAGTASASGGGGGGGGGGAGYRGGTGGGAGSGAGGCGGSGGGAGSSYVADAVEASSITTSPTMGDGRITLTWLPRPASTSLQVDQPTHSWGDPLTVTATVPVDATGTVRLVADAGGRAVVLGTFALPAGANAGKVSSTVPVSMLGIGTHQLTAQYSGDSQYAPTTSDSVTVTVGKDVPQFELLADRTTVAVGEAPTLTAVLPGDASGTVTFVASGAGVFGPIGTAPVVGGVATLSEPTGFPSTGLVRVAAISSGDAIHQATTSPSVLVTVGEPTVDASGTGNNAITYPFAGGVPQEVTVPDGATAVQATVVGASGGDGARNVKGGAGAAASGIVPVTPGQVLTLTVGGRGGDRASEAAGGGGAGWAVGGPGNAFGGSAGGGGASALVGPQGPLLVAAGGGGAGGQGEFGTDAYRGGAGGAAGATAGNGERGYGPSTCLGQSGTGGTEPRPTGGIGGAGVAPDNGAGGGGGGGVRGGSGGTGGRFGGCGGGGGGAGTSLLDAAVQDGSLTTASALGDGRVVLTWLPQPTDLSVAVTPSTPRWGAVLTVTATVPTAATGTVRFTAGDHDLGVSALVLNGGTATASVTVPASLLGVGQPTITARYSGDAAYQPATATASPTIATGAPRVELLADPTTVEPGAAPRLTAVLPGNATGTVRFVAVSADGTSDLGSAPVAGGLATVTPHSGFDAAGGVRVRVDYSGDGIWSAASSLEPLVTVGAGDGGPSTTTSTPSSTSSTESSTPSSSAVSSSTELSSSAGQTVTSSADPTTTTTAPVAGSSEDVYVDDTSVGSTDSWSYSGAGNAGQPAAYNATSRAEGSDLAVTGVPLAQWLVIGGLLLLVGGAVGVGVTVRERRRRAKSG